jgi:AcrR family transcriptional regulator
MPPQKPAASPAASRAPRRQRGRERVAALLAAAADCFVEQGYAGTTMTAVAARAGSAIGSLYQFFPTKELLAQALLDDCTGDLYARLQGLAAQAPAVDADRLGATLIRLLVDFRRRHPAFVALIESAPIPTAQALAVRRRVRAELQAVLAAHAPWRGTRELHAAATVAQQLMKAAVAVNAEPGMPGRKAALDGLQRALQLYLREALAH